MSLPVIMTLIQVVDLSESTLIQTIRWSRRSKQHITSLMEVTGTSTDGLPPSKGLAVTTLTVASPVRLWQHPSSICVSASCLSFCHRLPAGYFMAVAGIHHRTKGKDLLGWYSTIWEEGCLVRMARKSTRQRPAECDAIFSVINEGGWWWHRAPPSVRRN